jgi:copper(I)-binding protein
MATFLFRFAPHALMTFISALVIAGSAFATDVAVTDPWVRSTVPGQPVSGAYMTLTSKAGATLLSVTTAAAGEVEVHEMKTENGIMKMRAIDKLDLPAGKPVSLSPGGYHIMLMSLKGPLKVGEKVALELTLSNRAGKQEKLVVQAPIKAATSSATTMQHEHSEHEHMHH